MAMTWEDQKTMRKMPKKALSIIPATGHMVGGVECISIPVKEYVKLHRSIQQLEARKSNGKR